MISHQLVFSSKIQAHSKRITSICFSSDNKLVATTSQDKTIKVWQFKSGKLSNIVTCESNCATSAAFSQDNKVLVSGEKDNTIKLWSLATKKLIHTLSAHQKEVNSIAVHPKGKSIAR